MLIILLLTFWYATIQYRKGELKWIFFVYMFFKTNYIWILLRYVKVRGELFYTHTQNKTIKYSLRRSDVPLLSVSLEYVSIQ